MASGAVAAELKPETVEAFNRYIATAEMRLEPRFQGTHFLWFDQQEEIRQQLLRGDIVVQHTQGNGIVSVKGGLIEDSVGAVFIPNTNLKIV